MRNKRSGFSLVEILLVLAIISILSGTYIVSLRGLQIENNINNNVSLIAQVLQKAQMYSQGIKKDAYWGVRVEKDKVVIFEGPSFESRNISSDEVFDLAGNVSVSGLVEIVFDKLTGNPQDFGAITINADNYNSSRTLNINEKGVVNF